MTPGFRLTAPAARLGKRHLEIDQRREHALFDAWKTGIEATMRAAASG